jgi:hypothetical protein
MADRTLTNLPKENLINDKTVVYFEGVDSKPFKFAAGELDAVVGFFTKRGYDQGTATNIAPVFLRQAKIDSVPVFELLDKLSGSSSAGLSQLVTEILNINRYNTSQLGYRKSSATGDPYYSRNNLG